MILKIYGLIWALGLMAVAALYMTGNFNQVVATVFGFLSFGAIFMGMMFVLPSTVVHHAEKH
ncbi:MAG TPA: hypothetical protein VK308_12780 [Pyrinomonadaceae bacterium]|nr:hypothetical protein [Pyrinomonadaceae bacterium]